MRIAPFAAFATLSLLASTVFASTAFAAEEVKGPWDGFGVGTTVTTKSTMTAGGMAQPATQSRQSLVKITDDAYTIKMESEMGGQWTGMEIPMPRKAQGGAEAAPKPEDLGEEKVTVEGKDYTCKKQRVTLPTGTTTTWTADKTLVLKSETTAAGGMTSTMVVTKIGAKTTVAGKEFVYDESKTVTKSPGMEIDMVSWTSKGIPGWMLRSEQTMKMGDVATTTLTEVTAVEVK